MAERYYGVNTFCFINSQGDTALGRYRLDPMVDEPYFDEHDGLSRPSEFLAQELANRLRNTQVDMRLMLQLPTPGDALHDGSSAWPHTGAHARQEIELGVISVQSTDYDVASEAGLAVPVFNPGNLIDGLALSEDPMILARQRTYELAVQRRQQVLHR